MKNVYIGNIIEVKLKDYINKKLVKRIIEEDALLLKTNDYTFIDLKSKKKYHINPLSLYNGCICIDESSLISIDRVLTLKGKKLERVLTKKYEGLIESQ